MPRGDGTGPYGQGPGKQAGDWGAPGVWGGWEETALAQVPVEIAYVLVVEQRFITR